MQLPTPTLSICVKTNVFSSHLACIRQLKPALLNGRTDSRCCISSRQGWYQPPQEMRTSSPGHTHSHIAQLGLLFPVSRNQAQSCTISVRCHHPACLGNIVGFFSSPSMLIRQFGHKLGLVARSCWQHPRQTSLRHSWE